MKPSQRYKDKYEREGSSQMNAVVQGGSAEGAQCVSTDSWHALGVMARAQCKQDVPLYFPCDSTHACVERVWCSLSGNRSEIRCQACKPNCPTA